MGLRGGALPVVAALLAGCAGAPAPRAELTDTYWRPVEIDGQPVPLRPDTRELQLVFSKAGSRVGGYAACNAFAGSFRLEGEMLRFGPMAVTRRACIGNGASELEASFLQALEATRFQKISGDSLELRDAGDKIRLKLEARHSR